MSKGYIKIHRQIQNCWIWNTGKFDKRSAWIDLLMSANHREVKMLYDGKLQEIQRGQFITSIKSLAERWEWSKSTVFEFLNILALDGMLNKESDSKRTLITIINYDKYQIAETLDENKSKTNRKQIETNNNINNNTLSNDNVYNAQTSAPYSAHFEEFWKCYQKKNDKARAYEQYNARLKEGFSEEELLSACKNYMAECEREHREKKYIKDGKTFLSIHRPFIDYLPTKEEKVKDNIDIKKLFGLEFQQTPPYFGFPEQWFNGEELVRERVIPLVNPRDQEHGVSDDIPYSAQDLIDMFNARRRYFNGERTEIL